MSASETIVSTLKAKLLLDTLGFTQAADSATKSVSDIALKFKQAGKVTSDVVKDVSTAAMNFETAFTGVMKTIDAPKGKNEKAFFSDLRKEILDMSEEIPVAATEIASVYQAAGQLGIESENLTVFSKAMLQLASATNLTSEEAATSLAQFANVMQTDQTLFSNMGSAIVALGNNFATNEKQIVSFAKEMGIAGKLMGLSEADVLGFGTAMASMGLDAGSSGTAFQRFGQTITTAVAKNNNDLKVLAKTAGMSTKEFKAAWEENATGALLQFLNGLGELSAADQLKVFDDLSISQQQEITMLQSLASNTELVTDAVNMSNDAWEKNMALAAEFDKANGTTEAQLQLLKNAVTRLAIDVGTMLIPIIRDVIEFVKPLIEKIRTFANEHPGLTKGILAVGLALGVIGSVISTLLPLVAMITGAGGLAAIGTTLAGIIGPALPVIAVIGAVIAIIQLLRIAIENNFLGLGDRFNELKETVKTAWEGIKGYWHDLKDTFEEGGWSAVFDKIGNDAAGLWNDKIKPWFDQIGDNIRAFFENFDLAESVKALGDKIGEKVSGFWDESIVPFFNQIGDNIRSFFENLEIVQSIEAFLAPAREKFEEFKNSVAEKLEPIKEKFEEIKTKVEELKNGIAEKLEPIKQKWEELKTSISEKIDAAKAKIDEFIQKPEDLRAAIEEKVNSIKQKWEEFKSTIAEKIEELKTKFDDIKEKISGFLDGVDLSSALQTIIDSIITTVSGWWASISSHFDTIKTNISTFLDGVDLSETLQTIVDGIVASVSGWWGSIRTHVENVTNGIREKFEGVEVTSIVSNMVNGVKEKFSGWWESIAPNVNSVKDGIVNAFDGIWSKVQGIADNIVSKLQDAWSWVKKLFNGGKEEEPAETPNSIDMPENMVTLDYDNLTPIPENVMESYGKFRDIVLSLNTAIRELNTMVSPEMQQNLLSFLNLQIDEDALNGWTMVTTAFQNLKNELMDIMILMTGGTLGEEGEIGQMGDLAAGQMFAEALYMIAAAAEETGPIINESINLALGTMKKELLDIMAILTGGTIGKDGELSQLGDMTPGQVLADSLMLIADAATEAGPLIDAFLNPVFDEMRKHLLSIVESFDYIHWFLRLGFKQAVEIFLPWADKTESKINGLKNEASRAADEFQRMADAIWNVIAALQALSAMNVGVPGAGFGGGFASGGYVKGGTTYLVGEEGPELFTPHRSGYIVPNDELRAEKSDEPEIKIEINGNIYGESYLTEFVAETLTGTIRKELALAG